MSGESTGQGAGDDDARERLGRLAKKAMDVTAKGAKRVGVASKAAVEKGIEIGVEKKDEAYRAVTFLEHREQVEQTMDQIIEVLVSLDARLARIERQLDGGDGS